MAAIDLAEPELSLVHLGSTLRTRCKLWGPEASL